MDPITAAALIGGGSSLLGGILGGRSQERAANTQAQAQLEAARLAARFRPVGVKTAFGEADFEVQPDFIPRTDPQTGEPVLDASGQPIMVANPEAGFLSEAGYTLSPELQAQQEGLMGMLPGAMQRAKTAFGQTPYQDLAGQYLGRAQTMLPQISLDPTQAAMERTQRIQALQAPGRAEAQEALFSNLAAKGLTGLGVTTGTGATVNPYMAAMQEAQAQQDALTAAESLDRSRRDIAADLELAGGLLGSAQTLEGYEAGRVGQALQPYRDILGQSIDIEALGQQALDIGTALGGGERTAAAALAGGMSDAARTRGEAGMLRGERIAGLFSGVGDVLGQYVGSQPQTVSGGLMPTGSGVMMAQQPTYNPYAANFNFSLPPQTNMGGDSLTGSYGVSYPAGTAPAGPMLFPSSPTFVTGR